MEYKKSNKAKYRNKNENPRKEVAKLECAGHNRMSNALCNVHYDIFLKICHLRLLNFASDEYAAHSLRIVKKHHTFITNMTIPMIIEVINLVAF